MVCGFNHRIQEPFKKCIEYTMSDIINKSKFRKILDAETDIINNILSFLVLNNNCNNCFNPIMLLLQTEACDECDILKCERCHPDDFTSNLGRDFYSPWGRELHECEYCKEERMEQYEEDPNY